MVILKIGGFLWSSGGTIDLSSSSGIRVNKRQPSSKVHCQKKRQEKKKEDYKVMKKAGIKCFRKKKDYHYAVGKYLLFYSHLCKV